MPDYLEFQVNKFIFKIATDRNYNHEGAWAKIEGASVRIGLSDYLQQRSGDVAFIEVKPEGTFVALGDEIAVIETIKVDIGLSSPVTGKVAKVNPKMLTAPETINQDPYGEGWMAVIETTDWETDQMNLLNPLEYFKKIKGEAEEEVKDK